MKAGEEKRYIYFVDEIPSVVTFFLLKNRRTNKPTFFLATGNTQAAFGIPRAQSGFL